jgi:hypothetical protein
MHDPTLWLTRLPTSSSLFQRIALWIVFTVSGESTAVQAAARARREQA